MATDTEQAEKGETEADATVDGGLCRLDPSGLPELDADEVEAPALPRDDRRR
jgi:hypothetical protein